MTHHNTLFIGGEWTSPSSRQRIEVRCASTEEVIGSVPEAREADVDAAVAAAHAALNDPDGWASWEPATRAAAMDRFADSLEKRGAEIARLVSAQNGMPIAISSKFEGVFPAVLLRYYAGVIRRSPLEEERPRLSGGTTIIRKSPIGVVGAIVPWNFPQSLAAFKYAPALAAGCTIVIKPSPETVLDSVPLAAAAAEAGIPPGVINWVPAGRQVGAYLVSHPKVDKVSFTGSTDVGRSIGATCGRLLRPVTLELGGKSAAIVLDDADLELGHIAENLFTATLLNNGQSCFLGTRVLAPRSRYTEVVELLAALAESLTVGDALDEDTQVGPLASDRQRERVERYIATGKAQGARLVAGGGRADRDRGWFIQPTIFADVDNSHVIAQEEIFGPVLAVIPYTDDEEAVRIANDSDYGLGGSVWTRDEERGLAIARRVHTGSMGLNSFMLDPTAPFGGVKASGMGRELGPEAVGHYQQTQSILT